MHIRKVFSKLDLKAFQGTVLLAVDYCLPGPFHASVHVHDQSLNLEPGLVAAVVVHDLDDVLCRIPLDVKRLRSLLAAEIRSVRLKIPVICLPGHGRPCRVGHPQKKSLPVDAPGLEHALVAVVVDELRVLGELLDILGRSVTVLDDLIEGAGSLSSVQGVVVLSPEYALWLESLRSKGPEH